MLTCFKRKMIKISLYLISLKVDDYVEESWYYRWALNWVSCDQGLAEEDVGALCEAGFGLTDEGALNYEYDHPFDASCLDDISFLNTVIEYRYHFEPGLTSREISCGSMHVDYRRGNTCYKKTDPMDWIEARRQCWLWGGDLAFPLPPEECQFASYMPNSTQLWVAAPVTCGTERCEIPFSSDRFKEGTYNVDNKDLCFTQAQVDPGCLEGECYHKRPGLCALAPARSPRTFLPLGNVNPCPTVAGNESWWPFQGYSWAENGVPGLISFQQCPDGLNGNASWICGQTGGWLGFPDLSNCSKIDTASSLNELRKNNSVPVFVISELLEEVEQVEDIGAGDIANIINVLEEALKVQNRRIVDQKSQAEYADNYTRYSSLLMNDVLSRPSTWIGIPKVKKRQELSRVQINIEGIAESLIKYSAQHQHVYNYDNLVVKVLREKEFNHDLYFSLDGSVIAVDPDSSLNVGVSFNAFPTLQCIINELNNW